MPKYLPAIVLLVSVYLFARIFSLEKSLNFSSEQGLFLDQARQIYITKKPTLIGPATSIKSSISREFYQGPATYYLLLIPIYLGGDPITASYFMIFINLGALLVIYVAAFKKFGPKAAFLASLIFATIPPVVNYTRFVWNPNFIFLFAAASSSLLIFVNKKKTGLFFGFLGCLLGLALQFHYQSFLLIAIVFVWLFWKKIPVSKILFVFAGILIGFSPLVIFELRHDFYNLRTLFLILQTGTGKEFSSPPFYYFICLVPLGVIYAGFLGSKLLKKNKYLFAVIIFFYLTWSAVKIFSFSKQASGMTKGWDYLGLTRAVSIIVSEKKNNYNIADLTSGDTRFWAMRYMLIQKGQKPGDVGSYPQADWLFVLSRESERDLLKDPVWELSSFGPKSIAAQWQIENNYYLYLLEKQK